MFKENCVHVESHVAAVSKLPNVSKQNLSFVENYFPFLFPFSPCDSQFFHYFSQEMDFGSSRHISSSNILILRTGWDQAYFCQIKQHQEDSGVWSC